MEFLNIGGLELAAILLIAFIVLGPNRITDIGRKLGESIRKLNRNQTFRDVVQTTDELRNYPRRILRDAMLDEPLVPGASILDPETRPEVPDQPDE